MNTETKHTPEPWVAEWQPEYQRFRFRNARDSGFGHYCGWSSDGITTEEEDAATAKRIVACVNVCAGMTDPAKEIDNLKRELCNSRTSHGVQHQEIAQLKADKIARGLVEAKKPFWWMPRRTDPTHAGWYYVREVQPRLCIGIRYFDDSNGSWWSVSKDGRNDGSLVPNETFHDWLTIPNISDKQRT